MMAKTAYATRELCELLSLTRKSVLDRARRESWQSRPHMGRGGGNEWIVISMPEATRQTVAAAVASRIARTNATAYPAIAPGLFTVNTVRNIPERKRERASARALLVSMAREFQKASGAPRTNAYDTFCHEYNRGTIEAPEWARALLPSVCRKSLTNWEQSLGNAGLEALSGKQGKHRLGTGVVDATPGMADVIIAHLIKFYDTSAEDVLDALTVTHAGQRLPSLRNLQRWMKRYRADNPRTILKAQNPDAFRSRHQAAFGSRSAELYRINQLWELDSSPADVLLADGKRYAVIGGLDVGTRRTRLKLVKTSNAQGVCSLLRRMLLDFGVPETVKLDNGADYASFRVTTALCDLRIHPDYCTPFCPEQKPHIERFFGTFQRRLTKLPGFIGHSVADRKAIESQRSFAERVSRKQGKDEKTLWEVPLTPEEFQAFCDTWCADVYGERKHSALGMSPNEAAARTAAEGITLRIAEERALDILLMPIPGNEGVRHVNKDGIRAENGTYISAELGAYIGDDVLVRMDEDDAGRIYVFSLDGTFLCRAVDPDLTGVSRREIALAAKRVQKAVENRKAKEARQIVAKIKPQELIPQILEMQQQRATENRAERKLRFGATSSQEYTTPALEQAALAASAGPLAPPQSHNESIAAAREAIREAFATQADTWLPETPKGRYLLCRSILDAVQRNEDIPADKHAWARNYAASNEHSGFAMLYAMPRVVNE